AAQARDRVEVGESRAGGGQKREHAVVAGHVDAGDRHLLAGREAVRQRGRDCHRVAHLGGRVDGRGSGNDGARQGDAGDRHLPADVGGGEAVGRRGRDRHEVAQLGRPGRRGGDGEVRGVRGGRGGGDRHRRGGGD